MRTLRITVIFLGLTLALTLIVTALYIPFKGVAAIQGVEAQPDTIETLIPIACGLIVAPITLRVNRWVERRLSASTEKGKR